MKKGTSHKTLITLIIIAVVIVLSYPIISNLIQVARTDPDVEHHLEPIQKQEIGENRCLVTFTGEIEIEYEYEVKEIELKAIIEEVPEKPPAETFETIKNIQEPDDKTSFEIELETQRQCDRLTNPEVRIKRVGKKLF